MGNRATSSRTTLLLPVRSLPLLVVAFFLLTPTLKAQTPPPHTVVVNEIMFDPPDEGMEYVELFNHSNQAYDLRDLRFADARQDTVSITTRSVMLPPDDYAVLVRDSAAFRSAFPDVAFIEPASWPALNNGGDAVILYAGGIVDSVAYEPDWSRENVALERRDPAGPSNAPANFGPSTVPEGGTPGAQNSIYAPDRTPPQLRAVRASRNGQTVIVRFSEPLAPSSVQAADFDLQDEDGARISLSSIETRADTVRLFLSTSLTTGSYTLHVRDVADPAGNTLTDDALTFTYVQGAVPENGDIVINEIFYNPPDEVQEFVELYNRSGKTFDLADFRWSDDSAEPVPVSDTAAALAPGAYAVLARDTEALAEAFPGVSALEVPNWPALNNSGDAATLTYQAQVVDEIPYAPHWDGSDNRTSLERIDPGGPSGEPWNFGSATAEGGATPGTQNSRFEIDETPPTLQSVRPSTEGDTLFARFSELLDPASVQPADFTVRNEAGFRRHPFAATVSADSVTLPLSEALPSGDFVLRVRDVADRRGNRLEQDEAAFSYFVGAQPVPQEIVINEIYYDPPDENQEFIELFNRSDKTFDLSDLRLADADGPGSALVSSSRPFPPDAYAVIARDVEAFQSAFPEATPITLSDWPTLPNAGGTPRLLFDSTLIDAVPYDPSWGGNDNQTSLERIDPSGPSSHAVNFGSSTASAGATPTAQNSLYGPDTTPPRLTFAEQLTATAYLAYFDEPLDTTSLRPQAFQLSETAPSALRVLEPETVRLFFSTPPNGTTLRATGLRDLFGNRLQETALRVAQRPAPSDLVVTEIMYAPRADDTDGRPDQPEYVEFLSRADRLLTLRGTHLTDEPNEHGEADTTHLAITPTSLPPNGYAVAFSATGSQLAEAFPEIDTTSQVQLLPIERASLGLRNDGDLIVLHRRDGTVLDSVAYRPDWHHPDLEEDTGVSLERIVRSGPSSQASNWASSVAEAGGTPGRPNSVSQSTDPPSDAPGLRISPSPFSPDGDGHDDRALLQYTLERPVSSIRVRIFDQSGRLVRTLTKAALVGRSGSIAWDGRGENDRTLRLGIYIVVLDAVDAQSGYTASFKKPVVLARPLD